MLLIIALDDNIPAYITMIDLEQVTVIESDC